MGWFQDYANFVNKIPGIGGVGGRSLLNAISNNDMDSARVQSFIQGLPFLGGVVRGIDQARYLEDYYHNTGFVPMYPSNISGYSGFASGLSNTALGLSSFGRSSGYNVKEGTKDLLTFYNYAYA